MYSPPEMRGALMGSLRNFLNHMDWHSLLMTVFTAAAALLCLTVHELCHGLTAYRLGDPTAKNAGRLTLNPLRHIDPLGLLLMLTAHVGWAKPVPVDMRHFKRPKLGMALTALAGPVSNFLLAWLFLAVSGFLVRLLPFSAAWHFYLTAFFVNAALLSVGLGIFNLIPVPPMDGSRILFAFFPDRIYYGILRYERYIMLAMLVLVWLGVFSGPLSTLIYYGMEGLCFLSGMPFDTALVFLSLF